MATTTRATGTFKPTSWDEGPWAELEHAAAPKLTRASVGNAYVGDLAGEGISESLMCYPDQASATYLGFERVVGRLGERSGSFVLSARGTWQDGAAATTWSVVPGSGTGELEGLRGDGGYVAGRDDTEIAYRLDYWFE
jgi:Protein of unknown function (DUF3224)